MATKKKGGEKGAAKKKAAPKKPAGKKAAPKKAAKKAAPKKASKSPPEDDERGPSGIRPWMVGGAFVAVAAVAFAQSRQEPVDEAEETETVEVPAPSEPVAVAVPEALRARVLTRRAHDREAFTQGLLWHDGYLYESTGLEGRSSLRKVDLETGEVVQRIDLEPEYFAEGLARVGERLFQLTWQDHVAFEYDLETFEKIREHRYEGEGWGLCYDGEHLVMSDGSDELTFRNPTDFSVVRRVSVTKVGRPVRRINELECARGSVYANIWQRDEIVVIDPQTGRVSASIQARGLLTGSERYGADVLNGIAYLSEQERFLITGKLWPAAFEVVFEER